MVNKSIFKDNRKPILNQVAINIPTPIKFAGECGLKWNEWWYFLLISIEKSPEITEEDYRQFVGQLIDDIGDRTTIWRIRKNLVRKGFLVKESANEPRLG